jgi:hypothetical protein
VGSLEDRCSFRAAKNKRLFEALDFFNGTKGEAPEKAMNKNQPLERHRISLVVIQKCHRSFLMSTFRLSGVVMASFFG